MLIFILMLSGSISYMDNNKFITTFITWYPGEGGFCDIEWYIFHKNTRAYNTDIEIKLGIEKSGKNAAWLLNLFKFNIDVFKYNAQHTKGVYFTNKRFPK